MTGVEIGKIGGSCVEGGESASEGGTGRHKAARRGSGGWTGRDKSGKGINRSGREGGTQLLSFVGGL